MYDSVRIAVCEDIEEDKNILVGMISDYLDKNGISASIDTYISGEEFLSSDISVYSLVFFDIYMDKLNGMETAKRLVSENKSARLVFCTTTHDFAAESYDVSALYYIIKPVERTKLDAVLDRFFDGVLGLRTIKIKVGRSTETVYLRDIIYAESADKRTILHTIRGDTEVSMPFSHFVKELTEPDFVRPIRYALVSVDKIEKVPSETVTLSGGTVLPISRRQRQHVKTVFSDYRWKTAFSGKGGQL